jgi:hypothetical protein
MDSAEADRGFDTLKALERQNGTIVDRHMAAAYRRAMSSVPGRTAAYVRWAPRPPARRRTDRTAPCAGRADDLAGRGSAAVFAIGAAWVDALEVVVRAA